MATQTIIWSRSGLAPSASEKTVGKPISSSVHVNPDDLRSAEYVVYLHSISKRSFNQPNPIYRNVVVPACPKDKRYITFMRITHPVQIPTVDPNNPGGASLLVIENAKRVALSICNPSYVGGDLAAQDQEIANEYQISSSESNLTQQGVFASLNEIPTEEELRKAEVRRLAYYKRIFEEMNTLYRSNAKEAGERVGQDHHLAAEMFAIDVEWHKLTTPKIECPNCGEKIKEGIAFHRVNGDLCVLDWERAYLAGAVKKDQVPEPKRWWKEEKTKEQLRQDASALGIEVDARWSAETLQTKINDALSA
jgi:hypothetical protein